MSAFNTVTSQPKSVQRIKYCGLNQNPTTCILIAVVLPEGEEPHSMVLLYQVWQLCSVCMLHNLVSLLWVIQEERWNRSQCSVYWWYVTRVCISYLLMFLRSLQSVSVDRLVGLVVLKWASFSGRSLRALIKFWCCSVDSEARKTRWCGSLLYRECCRMRMRVL